ncbi:MAG: DUF58 domain-containing protein [Nitrospirota bacterium]
MRFSVGSRFRSQRPRNVSHLATKASLLLALTALVFLMAWNRDISLLYAMFALLTAVLLISLWMPSAALKGLSAVRTLSAVVTEGDDIELAIRVSNPSWRRRLMVEVEDSVPAAEPTARRPSAFLATLGARETRHIPVRVSAYKRGAYTVGPLVIRSAAPLGLLTARRQLPGTDGSVIVYPQTFVIASLPLMAARSTAITGFEALARAGGSDEIFGARDYRSGDMLRHVHWPATARRGQLVVKEFEFRASTDVTLMMDLHAGSFVGREKDSTLEYAVTVAASIARYALPRGHSVGLLGFGARRHMVPSGRGLRHLTPILHELALVEADGALPYDHALAEAAGLLQDGSTIVLFVTIDDNDKDPTTDILDIIGAKRLCPLTVILDARSFRDRDRSPRLRSRPLVRRLLAAGAPTYVLAKGDDLKTVFLT